MLVIAEPVGTGYYRWQTCAPPNPVLDALCELLLWDEARHVQFHAEWLGQLQARWLPAERAAWSLQFQLVFTAAANVAWFDHAQALRLSGAKEPEFFRRRALNALDFAAAR